MAYTLNNIASDPKNPAAKRGDSVRVKLDTLKIVEGFNERSFNDDEVREHVAAIAGAISHGLPIPPIEVWTNPETGDIEVVDGHCRYEGYRQYAANTEGFDGYVSAVKFDGTPAQRKARIVTSNNQLKLKPIELGRVYLSLRDEHSMSRQEIASEVGKSLGHVDQMILLASAKPEVIAAVEAGKISATQATHLTRDHGEYAPAELERLVAVAKESGKDKVTPKVATPKKESKPRPRIDFIVSCAVVLVNSLDADQRAASEAGLGEVAVRADILADLLAAVEEMQRSGKALDADKQEEFQL